MPRGEFADSKVFLFVGVFPYKDGHVYLDLFSQSTTFPAFSCSVLNNVGILFL